MKRINGFSYSTSSFIGYKYRAKIEVKSVAGNVHEVEIYTDQENKTVLKSVISQYVNIEFESMAVSLWKTAEQDKADEDIVKSILDKL